MTKNAVARNWNLVSYDGRVYSDNINPGGGGDGALEYWGFGALLDAWVSATATGTGNGTEGDPWTYAQAVALGAGLIVGIKTGAYTGASTGLNNVPTFNVPSGTFSNPTIFVCQWAAAYHVANRSTFSNGVVVGDGCLTIGIAGADFAQLYGPYVDEALSHSFSDTGPIGMFDSNSCVLMGAFAQGAPVDREDNHNGIRLERLVGCVCMNNVVRDVVHAISPSQNHAGIMLYSTIDLLLAHNDIAGCNAGIFLKGEAGTDIGNIRCNYNKIVDSDFAAIGWGGPNSVLTLGPNTCIGNLVDGAYYAVYFYVFEGAGEDADGPAEILMKWNTFANIGADEGAFTTQDGTTTTEAFTDVVWQDNLLMVDGVGIGFSLGWSLANNGTIVARGFGSNYNAMFGFTNWGSIGGGNYATRALYAAAGGYDVNSTTLTVDPFVDSAGGNFALNGTAGGGAVAAICSSTGGPVGYTGASEIPGLE